MKISELLKLLKEAEAECGDLPVLFVTGGGEYTPEKVSLVKARVSAVHFGSITGPHQTQPDRIVISGKGMFQLRLEAIMRGIQDAVVSARDLGDFDLCAPGEA